MMVKVPSSTSGRALIFEVDSEKFHARRAAGLSADDAAAYYGELKARKDVGGGWYVGVHWIPASAAMALAFERAPWAEEVKP